MSIPDRTPVPCATHCTFPHGPITELPVPAWPALDVVDGTQWRLDRLQALARALEAYVQSDSEPAVVDLVMLADLMQSEVRVLHVLAKRADALLRPAVPA
jgi:hypothetical protein